MVSKILGCSPWHEQVQSLNDTQIEFILKMHAQDLGEDVSKLEKIRNEELLPQIFKKWEDVLTEKEFAVFSRNPIAYLKKHYHFDVKTLMDKE